MMKHFMLPKMTSVREANPLSELAASPNPNPNKSKSHRKQKLKDKENSEPNELFLAGKPSPSPAKNLRSPLPPRPPPSNPLKRKLSNDGVVSDAIGLGPSSSSSDTGVRVIVRMRPLNKDEEEEESIVEKVSNESVSVNGHTFTYDSVATSDASQVDIFELVGAPLVENCLAGFNSSVFAYGQTGSGKTYTMWGPANALLEENFTSKQQGLTPRVFDRLFTRINEEQAKHANKQLKYQCRCSFLEIYNEQITDLLDPSQKNLQIREDVKSGVYVENLTEDCVSTVKDVIRILLKGLSHRRTGATSINAESSRSHSVFTCVVESQCKSKANGLSSFKTSRINLVDLAGSERQKLTGAAGDRLKEAGNINRSLSQLGNLINILAEISQTGKQRHIPYRDSRLTFLLQESLGGNAKLAMICAISPSQSCRSETFSTLRFAQRAKAIKNKAVVNEVMQDDVNVLREVIRQLKDELQRMKAHGNQADPNAAYGNSWNARRSLNLLKFSLNRPITQLHLDDGGDTEMEIVEEAVEKLCHEVSLSSASVGNFQDKDGGSLGPHAVDSEVRAQDPAPIVLGNECIEKQISEESDVSMEEGLSEIDVNNEILLDGGNPSCNSGDRTETSDEVVDETPYEATMDGSVPTAGAECTNNDPLNVIASSLSIVPCDASHPTAPCPAPSVSPRLFSSSRKSLRTSSTLTASQKEIMSSKLGNQGYGTTEQLAASLHRGLEIIDNQRQSSAFRTSPLRFSFKLADLKPVSPVPKVDVGIQTVLESNYMFGEDGVIYLCRNCRNKTLEGDKKQASDCSNLQLVAVDSSPSTAKLKKQVPKAVEKVLAGAIRREMALEDFCVKQTHEITHLNRLVQQYKHERECNTVIGRMREDKIMRLENLVDGVVPSEDFMEEELLCLRKEHELLKEKYENHPDVLETKIELKRVQDELERLRNFFDMGEKEVLLEEIHDLRSQLQYYTDGSPKSTWQQPHLQLTYPCEPRASVSLNPIIESCEPGSSSPLNPIAESSEVIAIEQLEQERGKWNEVENQWISLTEELKLELESIRSHSEKLERELVEEKKCSEDLKEAMQLAMQGHARMLEQYADLEEKHMQMLARHRKMQEGIGEVKKAAARAGVKGTESKFINALAAEISALRVEREKERRYLRDENKMLQSQLRDTAEAVQAAGELLVRLKESEEAIAAAEIRAAKAEEENEKTRQQIEKLKQKHEMETSSLNQALAESRLPNREPNIVKYDMDEETSSHEPTIIKYDMDDETSSHEPTIIKYNTDEKISFGDERWKDEFEGYLGKGVDDDLSSQLPEPSSWFSGYDRCNI